MNFKTPPAVSLTESCEHCGKKFGLFTSDESESCNCGATDPSNTTIIVTTDSGPDTCAHCGKLFALFAIEEQGTCRCSDSAQEKTGTVTRATVKLPEDREAMDAPPLNSILRETVGQLPPAPLEPEMQWYFPWYEIIDQLPAGTFCHVLKARRAGFDNIFAIKILKPEFARNRRMAKRFEAETRKAYNLDHPNLSPIYEYGTTEKGLPYFVTDFIDGIQLSSLLKTQVFLSEDDAIEIFIQICDALIEAHANGMIHRSLTPANVFLAKTKSGALSVKVTDVGIAKVVPTSGKDKLYATPERIFGDARYMSPEQCRAERLDARTDIYSLGCVMYHALGGKAPFSGSSDIHVGMKQIEKNPVPLSTRFPDLELSAAMESLVMKALTKEKGFRYQTVADVKRDLLSIRESMRDSFLPPISGTHILVDRAEASPLPRLLMIVLLATVTASFVRQLDPAMHHRASQSFISAQPAAQPIPAPFPRHRRPRLLVYEIQNTENKVLFSAYGQNLGQVLEQAARYGVDLTAANLAGQNLRGLDLTGAILRGACFNRADLSQTNFTRADLNAAQFSGDNLHGTVFDQANLRSAIFTDSDMGLARLYDADVRGAYFRDCNLDGANLSSADFTGASIYQVDLPEASFVATNGFVATTRFPPQKQRFAIYSKDGDILFKNPVAATFKDTIETAVRKQISLQNADLRAADLYEANLANADLRGADLRGALLSHAELSNADLTGASAQGVTYDESISDIIAKNVAGWQVLLPSAPQPIPSRFFRWQTEIQPATVNVK